MKSNRLRIKRFVDLMLSTFIFILLLPLMCFIYISIMLVDGCPVLFKQMRPGYLGKPFTIYKFRTMNNLKQIDGKLLPDKYRLTGFGKFLRKTSLDELPELWNVVKGDMSLVGPRPLMMEYLKKYPEVYKKRFLVKPGITGLAQIKGRQKIKFSERLNYDLIYVDNMNFFLDFLIIVITIPNVLFSNNVILGQDVEEVDDLGLSKSSGVS